ncbi:hypothetical protein G1C95_1528 [Bifidobacterium sp. DSM 109957]|uniref:Uncharacterized protein n=1 Tax=Bifidobacterium oedipodis TaxID=2675322 RepID=A0A7Y0EQ16_9BIFI|nr:hypothetical protein [Bifidobacterium sp. DSM 109957]
MTTTIITSIISTVVLSTTLAAPSSTLINRQSNQWPIEQESVSTQMIKECPYWLKLLGLCK